MKPRRTADGKLGHDRDRPTNAATASAVASHDTRTSSIPFLDLQAQFANIRGEVIAAVTEVLESQHFILGPEVSALEREVAEYVHCRYALGCASGSDALLLALMVVGISPGDEVITTPFTFGATAGAIARLGARPVFVDIDAATFNIDPERVSAAITPRTRAILPVHLFGLAADMGRINEIADGHGIPVIEDAAQAIGADLDGKRVGSLGTAACFSFFPSKNLGGAGDGGMMTTNDSALYEKLKILRVHGCRQKYHYEVVGMNSRLDAMQAAILRVKLRHLDQWSDARRRNAATYDAAFRSAGLKIEVRTPEVPSGATHVYNQYSIRVRQRDALRNHLKQRAIPTEIYYPVPLHTEPAYRTLGYHEGDFPNAEAACREVLALPIYPELTSDQLNAVVNGIADFYD